MKHHLPLLLGLCLSAFALSSCLAPARISRSLSWRVEKLQEKPTSSLHTLLDKAITTEDAEQSAEALGQFVERWKMEKHPAQGPVEPDDADQGETRYQVTFTGSVKGENPLDYYDEIYSAADFKIGRIKHHQRPGLGAPLIALRENKKRVSIETYYPPEAITTPITAFARPGPIRLGTQSVTIQLLNSLREDSVWWMGRKVPLAADFSAPWATALSRTKDLRQAGILDVVRPKPKREPQLYLMQPYDPNKEPLIMIHGLLSTPLAWASITNDLWANPEIRHRYQIWHYLYNTSAPALYSTRVLRAQLRELRRQLDPEGDDPAMQKTTLLTHSMGGLIGKSLAVDPGTQFWDAAFQVPFDSLKLAPEDRETLREAFLWEPDRSIHRIIYIAVPHRGSAFADNILGRIGSALAAPPITFRSFYKRISESNPGVFTPEYERLGQGKLDSISSLSPRQPTLRILADMKLPPRITVHSIIGNRGLSSPLEKSSDNIVPYTSSHLDEAASELIVPTGHGAFNHPEAITEIIRILTLPSNRNAPPTRKIVDTPRYMREPLRTSGGA